jgi:exosortase A-associated hydrolase 1
MSGTDIRDVNRGCCNDTMNFEERALVFPCADSWLYGILTLPVQSSSRGVLILVGGPQYRVGSHRQFTLLARQLATHGVPVLRFDYRGMGDSEGDVRTFENVGDDLRCAIDKFLSEAPFLNDLVILGLCDAASAALFYAYKDQRVTGLILVNPWVRTDGGAARVYLRHYYIERLFQRELWRKIWNRNFDYAAAANSLFSLISQALTTREKIESIVDNTAPDRCHNLASLPERMLYGLNRFKGKVLLILSGNDFTAQEFCELVRGSGEWQKLLADPQVSRLDLPDANHTFSRREWRNQVAACTANWIYSW